MSFKYQSASGNAILAQQGQQGQKAPAAMSEVEREVGWLESALSSLSLSLDELTDRLGAVLCPAAINDDSQVPEPPCGSTLGSAIQGQRVAAENIHRRLRTLIDSLGI